MTLNSRKIAILLQGFRYANTLVYQGFLFHLRLKFTLDVKGVRHYKRKFCWSGVGNF